MRLSETEKQVIKQAAVRLDANARVYLFGSRVNDAACGGDIDLLIDSDKFDLERTAQYRWELMSQLGEQKFDIVNARHASKEFVALIRSRAVEL